MFSPLLNKKAAAVGSAADGFKEKSHGAVTRRGQLDNPWILSGNRRITRRSNPTNEAIGKAEHQNDAVCFAVDLIHAAPILS
jgi:hypothetical protein